jgi:sporulation protein YlmC with PRC-barrel domain
MLEIIILGFVFWIGYEIGLTVTAYRLRHLVYKEAKRVGLLKEVDAEFDKPTVEQLYIEKTNDILYLYNNEDKSFLCQAESLDELATLAKKYNNVKYAAVMIGEEIYAFVDGKVKSEKEIIK